MEQEYYLVGLVHHGPVMATWDNSSPQAPSQVFPCKPTQRITYALKIFLSYSKEVTYARLLPVTPDYCFMFKYSKHKESRKVFPC